MDFSSIIKTVISLADVVIKKPTTSVQNSGIDLSSIINMASVFMGGNNNSSAGGGLGSILGSALGSGTLGGLGSVLGGMMGGGQQQQTQQKQQSGGGMGDILGGVLGGMMGGGQQQQQSSGGGLGDLLGQLTSRAGTISNMLDTNNGQKLTSDEKNNLTDVLNIINATKMFAGK